MQWASIDPGLNHCGVAVWEGPTLVTATLVRDKSKSKILADRVFWLSTAVRRYLQTPHAEPVPPIEIIVIEMPQTYGGKAAKGDTNDLLNLSLLVGALIHAAPAVALVKPREWKGTVPGDVMTERIRSKSPLKTFHGVPKSLEHNVFDAIGLGLWWKIKKSY